MTTGSATPRAAARRLIEEARSRGAHDDCMDTLLFTLEESGYAILPKEAEPSSLRTRSRLPQKPRTRSKERGSE